MSDITELAMPPDNHPLFKLGGMLAHYLDADHFNNAEQLLLQAYQEELKARQEQKEKDAKICYDADKSIHSTDLGDMILNQGD